MRKKIFVSCNIHKFVAVVLLLCFGIVVAKVVRKEEDRFALAKDCPRGALVYAQFSDLPSLIKGWNESKLKAKYLESTNYKKFSNEHLALKLIDRLVEFNTGLGFTLDVNALIGATDRTAAIALYDIGKLDAVFIAPISSEKIAQTIFEQNKDKFEEIALDDETSYYSLSFDADRGRLKQKFLFAAVNGRFVIATNETLFLRTLANINGKAKKDSLTDEPLFSELSRTINPHDATVWVNQTKLNQDMYFNHYWLMSNVNELKNIQAGIFDVDMNGDKWIERREFITTQQTKQSTDSQHELDNLKAAMTEGVPFLKLKTLDNNPNEAEHLIRKTLFDTLPAKRKTKKLSWDSYSNFGDTDYYDYEREYYYYSSLGEDFDKKIDDAEEAGVTNTNDNADNEKENSTNALHNFVHKTQPLYAAYSVKPEVKDEPFFAEFNRALVFKLQNANAFRSTEFEEAIKSLVENHLLVSSAGSNLKWAESKENKWRELDLPMLGWKICYKFDGSHLILSNNEQMIDSILNNQKNISSNKADKSGSSYTNLTVINHEMKEAAFGDVIERLKDEDTDGFFYYNISSLLDVLSDVRRVEIKRKTTAKGFSEEVEINLKTQRNSK